MPWRQINYNVPGTTSTRQYQILHQTAPRVKIFSCVLQKATLLFMTWLLEVMWLIMALQHDLWEVTPSFTLSACFARGEGSGPQQTLKNLKTSSSFTFCDDKYHPETTEWNMRHSQLQVSNTVHYFVLCFLFICELICFFLIRKCENKMKINLTIMNLTTHRNLPVISNSFVFCSHFSNFLLPEVFSGPCSTLRWPHLL